MNSTERGFCIAQVIFLLLLLALILLYISYVTEQLKCKDICSDALSYDSLSHGTLLQSLTGNTDLKCICYFADETKTRSAG